MSHIDSVSPAGPLTLAPGASINVDVLVSGVPGDDTATLRFTASDGSTVTSTVTIDREALKGSLGSGAPAASEVFGELVGAGTLESVGGITGGWRFRYTAG